MLCLTCWATDNIVVTSTGNSSLNLQKLREDLDRLQAHVYTSLPLDSSDGPSPSSQDSEDALEKIESNKSAAQLSVKLEVLRNEIAELRGKLEEAEHTAALQAAKFEKLEQQLTTSLAKIAEDKAPKSPTEPSKEATTSTEKSEVAPLTPRDMLINDIKALEPQAAYTKAKEYISQGDYEKAEIALMVLVENSPEHDLTGIGYYFLGEIYYIQKNFKEAIGMFAESYKTQPQGPKAPEALMKMAQSFAALHQHKEACATLAQLKKAFPKMDASIKTASKKLSTHLKCIGKESNKPQAKDLTKDK